MANTKFIVVDEFWYVTDLLFMTRPRILKKAFDSERSARNAIQRGLHGNIQRYDVIEGWRAKELGFRPWGKPSNTLARRFHNIQIRVNKYSYPPKPKDQASLITAKRQWKKSFRTLQRWRARRDAKKTILNLTIKEQKPKKS